MEFRIVILILHHLGGGHILLCSCTGTLLLQICILIFFQATVVTGLYPASVKKVVFPAIILTFTIIAVDWHVPEPKNGDFILKALEFLDMPGSFLPAMVPAKAPPSRIPYVKTSALLSSSPPLNVADINITSPIPGSNYAPGDTVQVSVSAPPSTTQVMVMLSGGPYTVIGSPPYNATLQIPIESVGEVIIAALSADAGGITGGTSITVNSQTSCTLTELQIWPDSALYMTPGQNLQLSVTGVFSDGVERKITSGLYGCSYSSEISLSSRLVMMGSSRLCCRAIV